MLSQDSCICSSSQSGFPYVAFLIDLIFCFIHSFIHSSTHSLLSFPPISFLLNQLCFSFKFVESFLSCILQDGISGDDVPPLGGGTQRRLTGQEGEKCESTILRQESISCNKIISQKLNTHFRGSVLY